jgi:3-hydroxyisobutyrate dehydrogenase-like beta-hydroxyacid dehydrogenase
VAEGAAAGSLLVECSTIDPDVTRRVAARLRPRGVGVADAAIGRSLEHARRGEASLMVGADDATYQRALPVLTALASEVTRCGEVGAGVTMKLVNNLLAATILAADIEALALAAKAGLDPQVVVRTLTSTAARNAILEDKIPREVLARGARSDFKVRLAHKDVGHAQNLAARLGVPLFALAPVRQLYGLAIAEGRAEEPTACLAELFEEWVGLRFDQTAG